MLTAEERFDLAQRIRRYLQRTPEEPACGWFELPKWSFLGHALHLLYRNFDRYHEFDGMTDGLELPWEPARPVLIDRGRADPSNEEMLQWQRVRASSDIQHDWACLIWIVP